MSIEFSDPFYGKGSTVRASNNYVSTLLYLKLQFVGLPQLHQTDAHASIQGKVVGPKSFVLDLAGSLALNNRP